MHLLEQMCFTSQYKSDGEMKQFFCLGENIFLWHCSCERISLSSVIIVWGIKRQFCSLIALRRSHFSTRRLNCLSSLSVWDSSNLSNLSNMSCCSCKQESIPLGCVAPACQPYVFWWPLLGGNTSGWGDGGYIHPPWYSLNVQLSHCVHAE